MGLARRIRRLRKRKEEDAGKRRRKVLLEPLEPRLLLSADLSYTMSGAADDLTLLLDNSDGVEILKLIDNDDLSILASQALAETSAVEITGSGDADSFTIDPGLGNLLETLPISFLDSSGGDGDTLKILGHETTWNITGADAGFAGSVDFFGVENLHGGPDNADTFVFQEGGSLSGVIEGGDAGFDSLFIEGGTFAAVAFSAAGPDSGSIELNGNLISYSGLEPITLSGV
ncbi:MAG: LEPR-XLL domain-containing protein, partial [Deltaproteobacteria bacterium]|nr:LEPR-XLL domain-containing protein [Deltaproteobacteria bacterium]